MEEEKKWKKTRDTATFRNQDQSYRDFDPYPGVFIRSIEGGIMRTLALIQATACIHSASNTARNNSFTLALIQATACIHSASNTARNNSYTLALIQATACIHSASNTARNLIFAKQQYSIRSGIYAF